MYQQVIDFWFKEINSNQWWQKDIAFDKEVERKFLTLHDKAVRGELYAWRDHALSSLAEIILLDQFSRNIYRDTAQAFENDVLALALAQQAIKSGFDLEVTEEQRPFFYLPFMHSESQIIHEQAVILYTKMGNKHNLDFEIQHKNIIDRFGRYPHRNNILGRVSTLEEVSFLNEPNSSF